MITEVLRAAPVALLFALPVTGVGGLVLHRLRHRSITAAMTALGLLPLVAALAGVIAVSGFMYTPQLLGTVAVVVVVAAVTVPMAMLLGRGLARDALWAREMRDAERQSEAARRALVGGMSHDLRSPLAGIRGLAEALADGVVHEPAEVAEYLTRIHRETDRMSAMVEDLFQLSRATSPALSLTLAPLALGEVVSDAVAAETVSATGVAVTADDPARWPVVLGSDVDLTRVVRNLLSNALRHTASGREVHLTAESRDGRALLHVQDGCGGIPADDLGRVFDPGFRGTTARTPTRDGPGAGLGLAIARALVHAHGGELTVVNHGPGCRFTLALPLAGPGDPTPRSCAAPPASR